MHDVANPYRPSTVSLEFCRRVAAFHKDRFREDPASAGSTFDPCAPLAEADCSGIDTWTVGMFSRDYVGPEVVILDRQLDEYDIYAFMSANEHRFSRGRVVLGTYFDPERVTHNIFLTRLEPDREKAIALGRDRKQVEIFHLATKKPFRTDGWRAA